MHTFLQEEVEYLVQKGIKRRDPGARAALGGDTEKVPKLPLILIFSTGSARR